ncbi:MAG: YbaB/EbfC family nucleoid-associated protein [Clostridiales bacterium]|nr:YbaB/EbfC family nucleoid-associated protein [Clostridiales bacterium]
MAKGGYGYGGMGGMNMNNLMKQAQKMQKQMADMQKGLEEKKFEITSGGGAVKITILGNKTVEKIEISEDVVDPDDIEMLEDLILTAVNEAIRTVDETTASSMSKITGMSGMPGLF